ncbi:MAG: Bax inhibitor-1/YccA family protein [Bacteroidota bacterium]
MNTQHLSAEQAKTVQASFINKVYGWMSLALVLTGFVAARTASSEAMTQLIFGNPVLLYGLIFAELGLVIWMSAAINRISSNTAIGLFLLYSALNGLTLSFIFLVYTGASIATTFFVTALTFGVMSVYGYVTKRDLTSWGNLLFMALIGIIIGSIVNMFWQNSGFYWILTYLGVIVFVGLTAYDTQKIKEMSLGLDANSEEGRKGAILGALRLYLDFINLFLLLLRILGDRR